MMALNKCRNRQEIAHWLCSHPSECKVGSINWNFASCSLHTILKLYVSLITALRLVQFLNPVLPSPSLDSEGPKTDNKFLPFYGKPKFIISHQSRGIALVYRIQNSWIQNSAQRMAVVEAFPAFLRSSRQEHFFFPYYVKITVINHPITRRHII